MNNSDTNQAEQLNETAVMQLVLKPNNLRIGNLIEHKEKGFIKVSALSNNIIQYKDKYGISTDKYSYFKAIPLTEEWLLNLEFRTEENYSFELDNISINTKRELMWVFTKCKNNVELELPKYVHELQNIYFALTGSELTVTGGCVLIKAN
jgi:hypothetical protein